MTTTEESNMHDVSKNTFTALDKDANLEDTLSVLCNEDATLEGAEKGKMDGGRRHRGVSSKNRLSVVSMKYDVDGDGKLDEAEQMMRDMDTANVGHLSNEKVYQIMVEQMKLQQEVFSLKRLSIAFLVVVVFLSLATLGSSFAAAILAKDTDLENGNLVSKTDGTLVGTRSRGSHLVATVDMGFVRRLRRRMFGFETEDDRRILQEGNELVAKVDSKEVQPAFKAFEEDGTPITVTATIYGSRHTELVAGSGLSTTEETDEDGIITTWYRGLHAQEITEPTYDVRCTTGEEACDVYQIGDIRAQRRLNDDEKAKASRRLSEPCFAYNTSESECVNFVIPNENRTLIYCEWFEGVKRYPCRIHHPNLLSGPRQESFMIWAVVHFFIILVAIHQFS